MFTWKSASSTSHELSSGNLVIARCFKIGDNTDAELRLCAPLFDVGLFVSGNPCRLWLRKDCRIFGYIGFFEAFANALVVNGLGVRPVQGHYLGGFPSKGPCSTSCATLGIKVEGSYRFIPLPLKNGYFAYQFCIQGLKPNDEMFDAVCLSIWPYRAVLVSRHWDICFENLAGTIRRVQVVDGEGVIGMCPAFDHNGFCRPNSAQEGDPSPEPFRVGPFCYASLVNSESNGLFVKSIQGYFTFAPEDEHRRVNLSKSFRVTVAPLVFGDVEWVF